MEVPAKLTSLDEICLTDKVKLIDKDSPSSSMGAEVDRPISDVDLLRIMECPVCNEFPAPPIYSCEKGHFTCNSCIRLLESCSMCESPFTQVRNFALESIIENSKFKCRNFRLGCSTVVMGSNLNQHVSECLYRTLECAETDCLRGNLTPEEYFVHIVRDHGISGCEKELIDGKAVAIMEQNEDGIDVFSPYYVKVAAPKERNQNTDTCTFLVFSKRYRTFMCWWAVCLEPEKLNDYQVHFTLESESGSSTENLSVQWKLPLQPVWKTFDEIRDTGRCAVLPDTHLIPFITGKSWKLKVEFEKKQLRSDNHSYQHYYPLLLLIIVGIVAVICSIAFEAETTISGNSPDYIVNRSIPEKNLNHKEFSEEYIGYRGFYYKQ